MTEIRAVFFDVAHTLLHKPAFHGRIAEVLARHGINTDAEQLFTRHKLLMEAVVFPDRTSREFYAEFNSHLLRSIGVLPEPNLLEDIFSACSYLPWEAYADVGCLQRITLPLGVLSNWDMGLKKQLLLAGDIEFKWILGSAEQGSRKPNPVFFTKIISETGLMPNEIMYVGDSMRLDIEPALHLGLEAVLIDRHNLYPQANIRRIASLSELEFPR